ncbi:glucose-1-phosphate cytidylyltransferase [Labilibaculum sp. K2S]|uniref:glucose-1-phosphate cytidylyltransferase n=1 Tax=Labilibaculum sp. K2S TaxID=3056386 RepID=UPI0025A3854B|nr:glucose-1-phosphate cytidylyltransferase [Labilibaculum sp. K2S]MDM8160285.1 glucose-1-phosphate cytidylyltransferase [Labilibaculum sp. K2S]
MKLVILAGGYGTRMSESTNLIPKPMVEVGGKPILWHIMKIYSQFGINEFIICCGYKQYIIKEYFANYFRHNSDLTVDLSDNSIQIHNNNSEKWKVTIVDTGLNTMTGGRIKRIQEYVGNETFCLTYGDGVGNVNIAETIELHKSSGKILSMTTYQPSGKLGVLDISEDGSLKSFKEKPENSGSWINAGFFVCDPKLFNYLGGDTEMFEREPMQRLVDDNQVNTYKHTDFWMPMDTLRDNQVLNKMWDDNKADWKVW